MKKTLIMICIMLMMMTTYAMAVPNPNLIIEMGYDNTIYMDKIDSNQNIGKVAKDLTRILGTVGIGIGTCVGVIYAIMWITATPAKKADLKERAFPLVLGVILLFGGVPLAATFISAIAGMLQ